MYVPSAFEVSDGRILESFIGRYGFATLITSSSAGLIASHVPLTLRKRGDGNCLIGHMARTNNQWRSFDAKAESLAIFHGPPRPKNPFQLLPMSERHCTLKHAPKRSEVNASNEDIPKRRRSSANLF